MRNNLFDYMETEKQLLENRIPKGINRFQKITLIMLILQAVFMFQGLPAALVVIWPFFYTILIDTNQSKKYPYDNLLEQHKMAAKNFIIETNKSKCYAMAIDRLENISLDLENNQNGNIQGIEMKKPHLKQTENELIKSVDTFVKYIYQGKKTTFPIILPNLLYLCLFLFTLIVQQSSITPLSFLLPAGICISILVESTIYLKRLLKKEKEELGGTEPIDLSDTKVKENISINSKNYVDQIVNQELFEIQEREENWQRIKRSSHSYQNQLDAYITDLQTKPYVKKKIIASDYLLKCTLLLNIWNDFFYF